MLIYIQKGGDNMKILKYIALTCNRWAKYPVYYITIPIKIVKEMGIENSTNLQLEYDSEENKITLTKIN